MKKKTPMLNKRELLIGLTCLSVGALGVFMYMNTELSSNKELTKRILSNAIGSMQASQNLAESCSEAYNTSSTCVANLSTCNLQEEAKKLDAFNLRRQQADEQINQMNKNMEQIIKNVSAKR